MLALNRDAISSYKEEEIAYIQQIYIHNKEKLLKQKIVDRRVIYTIENLKDILLSFYQQKQLVEIRYALFLCIDHLRNYLTLMLEPDWPVDRNIALEIQVLTNFKTHFYSYLTQMNDHFTNTKKKTQQKDFTDLDLPKLLQMSLIGLETTAPMKTVADIARFIQFISYIGNDFNDLKGELAAEEAPAEEPGAAGAAVTTVVV